MDPEAIISFLVYSGSLDCSGLEVAIQFQCKNKQFYKHIAVYIYTYIYTRIIYIYIYIYCILRRQDQRKFSILEQVCCMENTGQWAIRRCQKSNGGITTDCVNNTSVNNSKVVLNVGR